MGSGGVAIAALPTVICLKVPFSDGLGGVISMIDEVNKIYKALLTIPQSGGEFRFRVVLTMESGEAVERLSDPVTFY